MPRNYIRKEKSYNEEDITKALEEVQDCISKNIPYSERAIAKKYNIQKDVFNRRLKGFNPRAAGRKMAIPLDQQEELVKSLKTMYRWGFGLFKEEIKDVVQEYVIKHNIQTPFKNNRPGNDWFLSFKELHNLTVKKPESLEVTRQNVTSDPFIIYDFYKQCESEITRLDLSSKPAQIYNLYESEFCTYPSKTEAVVEKEETAYPTIPGCGKENTIVLACANAAGKALPPLIVYESNRFWSSLVKNESQGMSKDTFLGVSPTGWMTSSLFHQWFNLFTKKVTERPILLLFDGNLTRLDIETIELACSSNITILKIPPHTTDLLQPLNYAVFGSLKTAWDKEVHILQSETQRNLTKADFANILEKVWYTGLSEANIKSGFENTGLFPTNLNKYPKRMLDRKKLDQYYESHNTEEELTPSIQTQETPNTETMKNLSVIDTKQSPPRSSTTLKNVGLTPVESHHIINDLLAIPSTSHEISSMPNRSFEGLLLKRIQPKQTVWPNQKRIKIEDGTAMT